MGYESEPLPSYPELRNFSYSVKLFTPLPHLFLRLIYRVLIPLVHYPDCPRHSLRLHSQCIYRPSVHLLYDCCLPSLYVYSDEVNPRGVHCLLYLWILPLSACPTFFRHPRDPTRHLMVEFCPDLEHLPGHHPPLASIE